MVYGFKFYNRVSMHYALNLGARGTFSPLRILSAPTFFPSLGHPDFFAKRLCMNPQELPVTNMTIRIVAISILPVTGLLLRGVCGFVMGVFIGLLLDCSNKRTKPTNIILYLQVRGTEIT